MEVNSLTAARQISMPDTKAHEADTSDVRKTEARNDKTTGADVSTHSGKQLDENALKIAVEDANKRLAFVNREFEYGVHEKTKQIMIKVLDRETKEVIREIPPEKTLDMAGRLLELAGILLDEKK